MKKISILLAGLFFISLNFAFILHQQEDSAEEQAVKDLVLKAYIHGAFNELNPEAMAEGFHPDFAIFSADGEQISRYPIDQWVAGVRKRKSSEDFDPEQNVWEHKFARVDVTGGAAAVKVELFRKGEHIYSDYLSLLRFDSGWKIVAKVYHRH